VIGESQEACDKRFKVKKEAQQSSMAKGDTPCAEHLHCCQTINAVPELGSGVENWARNSFRKLILGNYKIIYRVDRRQILIRSVIHDAAGTT
jgi:hypothetical protein